MKHADPGSRPVPRYVTNADGEPTAVTLEPAAYVALLIQANVTDPELWPPGMRQGAAALARVRAIERRCTAKHGEFDWEKLSTRLQDEYDSLCALLDRFQDNGARVPFRDYRTRRAENRR